MAFGNFFKKAKDTVVGLAKRASDTLVAGVSLTKKALRTGLEFVVGRKIGHGKPP